MISKLVSPRFLVAKHIPDLHRMEPRNIGIIAWADDGLTAAHFLGEDEHHRFKMPSLIARGNRDAYRQWIEYWRYQMQADGISSRKGETVSRSSPAFLDALIGKSKASFQLADGGLLLQQIPAAELQEFVDEMFERIVESPVTNDAKAESAKLDGKCVELFRAAEIERHPRRQWRLPVPRRMHGVLNYFTIDLAFGPVNRPESVLQKVLLSREQSVYSNILMFDALRFDRDNPLTQENCAAHGFCR